MHRQIVIGCLPYLGALLAAVAVAWLLLRLTRTRFDWRHVTALPSDQRGAVQSLSFVLTVPVFIMIMMFIVQLSQLTVAKVVVEYSALATARAAQVWVPADLSAYGGGGPNQLACWQVGGEITGPDGWRYVVYQIPEQGLKYQKIRHAAVQALLPICPSRDTGLPLDASSQQVATSLQAASVIYAPRLAANPQLPERWRNKLAYAQANTRVSVQVRHKEDEPPLQRYLIGPYPEEYSCGEIGWHDQLIVTVTHDFALLPGPGRLLARRVYAPGSSADPVAESIQQRAGVHVYTLQATARLYNEGQKPRLGYLQTFTGPASAGRRSQIAAVSTTDASGADDLRALADHAGASRFGGAAAEPVAAPLCCGDAEALLAGELGGRGEWRSVLRRKSP